jgi:hypothetical protein
MNNTTWIIAVLLLIGAAGYSKGDAEVIDLNPQFLVIGNRDTPQIYDWHIILREKDTIHGPLVAWKRSDGTVAQLTNSISSLDELLKSQATRLKGADVRSVQTTIGAAAALFTKQRGALVITPARHEALGKSLSEANLKDQLTAPKWTVDKHEWQLEFAVVTSRGAVELHSFKGTLVPLGVTSTTTTLAAPVGTIKDVEALSREN